jgi:type III pantothenate kinase
LSTRATSTEHSSNPALLIDLGNTRLKWGILAADRISRTGAISREMLRESGYSPLTSRLPRQVSQILVSNVAGPTAATKLASVLGIHCNSDVHFARVEKSAYGLSNGYRQPRRLGVDRWVAMIGARAEFRSALCVVDAGTAITIDAIDKSGRHLGGQIIPGLHLMGKALSADTSDIGSAARKLQGTSKGVQMFARSTRAAVQCGALAAVCGAVERALKAMRSEGFRPKLVLTGGDASRILKQLEGSVLHRPNLVLQGLAYMLRGKS